MRHTHSQSQSARRKGRTAPRRKKTNADASLRNSPASPSTPAGLQNKKECESEDWRDHDRSIKPAGKRVENAARPDFEKKSKDAASKSESPAKSASLSKLDSPHAGTSGKGQKTPGKPHRNGGHPHRKRRASGATSCYAALDLGTNNCRLLIAHPSRRGFNVVDAFSRIIRLGEGVARTGQLSEEAMSRTISALKICSEKMQRREVKRSRLIATEACRLAENGGAFIRRVREETGLSLEIVSRETEAKLAVSGCASLLDCKNKYALVFDIGGGSSELIWLDLSRRTKNWGRSFKERMEVKDCIACWTSLPVGVVTLGENFGGREVTPEIFEKMVDHVLGLLEGFEKTHCMNDRLAGGNAHLLGTSGTVTTIAGIHLGLSCYDRNKVDGCWMDVGDVQNISSALVNMDYSDRVAQPCIGADRADLVLAGCAILEAMLRIWPTQRLRVADRGLREGILATLMAEDGAHGGQRGRRRRHPRKR